MVSDAVEILARHLREVAALAEQKKREQDTKKARKPGPKNPRKRAAGTPSSAMPSTSTLIEPRPPPDTGSDVQNGSLPVIRSQTLVANAVPSIPAYERNGESSN